MPNLNDDIFSIRDILDSQLETSDGYNIGRVSDIEVAQQEDGSFVATHLIIGPQALAGRVALPLKSLLTFLLRDRFEHRIPLSEVKSFGPTLCLRGGQEDYSVGQSDKWIADHILRWIPGSGY